MTKEITEDEVQTFLVKLKAADNDKKVDQIQFFGLRLEDAASLPESTLDAITQTISPLLRSTSQLLVTSTLSHFLSLYIPLLPLTPLRHLQLSLVQLLPPLLEKLNDPKERIHTAAAGCISLLGKRCYEAESSGQALNGSAKGKEKEGLVGMWERCMREVMAGKGARGKLEAMKMLAAMRKEERSSLPLKPWLAPLVELLEDGDGPVREQAREVLVAMLSPTSTPPAARSELKKLLTARNVRKTIADPMLNRIFSAPPTVAIAANIPLPEDATNVDIAGSGAATPAGDDIPIVHIASSRDLEGEFAAMLPHFEGKETEHNWLPREKSIIRVRGMLRGNAHQQFREALLTGLKLGMMEGFLKTVLSLRTTVAQQSCAILQELAEHLGSSLDPFVDSILPVLGRMAGLTKKIIAEKSQRALVAYMCHTTCPPRMYINHFSSTISDKNLQIRHYTASHVKVYLDVQGPRTKSSIDTTPDLLDMLEGTVKRGIMDVNPGVRELARAGFWSFAGLWPGRGKSIMEGLDGMARKQLEKMSPGGMVVQEIIAPSRPVPAKRSTTMSALLAEKRRAAKAAESAVSSEQVGSPRIVSNPVPGSPSLQQGTPRAVSSTYTTPLKQRMTRSITSPASSSPNNPTPTRMSAAGPSTTPKLGSKSGLSSPRDAARSRSSSLARTLSGSPPPPTSPSVPSSLRTNSQREVSSASTRSSSAATIDSLRTPTLKRKPIPSYEKGLGQGIGDTAAMTNGGASTTPSRTSAYLRKSPPREIIDDALKAQADQALSAAEQLVDYHENDIPSSSSLAPSTPARQASSPILNGLGSRGDLLRTPLNGSNGRGIWEDSPRNQAVTPKFLEKLKGRRYERSWWARQQQLLEKASPLKQIGGIGGAKSIQADIDALESGSPTLRNLQKLVLFSGENRIPVENTADEDDVADATRIWEEERLFERVFEGLMRILTPKQPQDLLEQASGLLWEMVQSQWPMFEDKEASLMDALFRLRASGSHIILESTYSLLSLLTEVSDHLILLGIIQSSLERFLASHPTSDLTESISALSISDTHPSPAQVHTSAFIFALNGLGMCILHLPAPVVFVEASRLEPLLMTSLADSAISVRQAANTLILAIQCVIGDSAKTLGLFPEMTVTQRNLATYLMETNGVMGPSSLMGVEERRGKVLEEMDGLMARSMS